MKREADAGAMTGSGGPTSPHKRYRQGDDELRLLIPSKVSLLEFLGKKVKSPEAVLLTFQIWSRALNQPGLFSRATSPFPTNDRFSTRFFIASKQLLQ